MCILGLGCGLSYLSVVKNCWEYYPNRLGLVYGIIITGYRLSSSILFYIAVLIIIRPKNFLPDYNDFFPKEVSDKFLNYLIFLSILVFMLSILAVCLTFNYQEEEDLSKIEELNEKMKSENNDSSSLCRCFWSKKNLFLSFFCFCAPCI